MLMVISDDVNGAGSDDGHGGGGGHRRRRPATLGSGSRRWASGADSRARVRNRRMGFGGSSLAIQFGSRRVQSRVALPSVPHPLVSLYHCSYLGFCISCCALVTVWLLKIWRLISCVR
ncbi:hypothetical protein Hanom_Chr02g00166361 [Helianthus anomalus]